MAAPLFHSNIDDPSPSAVDAEAPFRVSGELGEKQIKQLARRVRRGHVGPTSVYYAGVTAPAITAGMATIVGASLSRAGVAGEWVVITSSLVAAMAGITWYLIFMRWSYRHSYGRSSELRKTTHIEADELGVYLTRGTIRTRISWDGIDSIATDMKFSRLHVLDGDDVLIPSAWFKNGKERKAAIAHLRALKAQSEIEAEAA